MSFKDFRIFSPRLPKAFTNQTKKTHTERHPPLAFWAPSIQSMSVADIVPPPWECSNSTSVCARSSAETAKWKAKAVLEQNSFSPFITRGSRPAAWPCLSQSSPSPRAVPALRPAPRRLGSRRVRVLAFEVPFCYSGTPASRRWERQLRETGQSTFFPPFLFGFCREE